MGYCTRRVFLHLVTASAGIVLGGETAGGYFEATIPVPPSIMLHARESHLYHLPALLNWLLENDYTPITYQTLWKGLTNGQPLPAKPVIVSIDDLTMVKQSGNFAFIEQMVNVFLERHLPAVLSVITEPVITGPSGNFRQLTDQDDDLWDKAAAWTTCGIELATHTTTHLNLGDSTLTVEDCDYQIASSARLIEAKTGQPVVTLVLPFGNGTINAQQGTLLPNLVHACRHAGIGIVVGIAGGRTPLIASPADEHPVYFVGRVGPLKDCFDSIYWDIEHW